LGRRYRNRRHPGEFRSCGAPPLV